MRTRKGTEETYYISDDGVYTSNSEYEVSWYESNALDIKKQPIYKTRNIYGYIDHLDGWSIYKCLYSAEYWASIKNEWGNTWREISNSIELKEKYRTDVNFYAIKKKKDEVCVMTLQEALSVYKQNIDNLKSELKDLLTEIEEIERMCFSEDK